MTTRPVMNMSQVSILDSREVEVTRHATSDEWDADDLSHTIVPYGFVARPDGDPHLWDVLVPSPVPDTLYLVMVTYETGDSFHHETGCVDYVEAFRHAEDAAALQETLRDYETDICSFDWVAPVSGRRCRIYTGAWAGYFERVEDISVATILRVEED